MNGKVFKGFLVIMLSVSFMAVSSVSVLAAEKSSEKERICHIDSKDGKGKVLSVSKSAVKAHIKHGDPATFVAYDDGSCKTWVAPAPTAPPAPPAMGGGF